MRHRSGKTGGFSLLELMITVTVMGLLLSLGVPSLMKWVRNNKVRASADTIQNGIRLAQTEALRRSHQVVFALTSTSNPATAAFTASTSGAYWVVQTIPFMGNETSVIVEVGALAGVNTNIVVSGPAQICFNSIGRLTTNTTTGITSSSGTTCDSTIAPIYNVSLAGSDTWMRITVGFNGQIHMCNQNKTFSTTAPDGC